MPSCPPRAQPTWVLEVSMPRISTGRSRRGRPRGRAARPLGRPRRERPVLILGIETSSTQVGCALGGHEGILAYTAANRGPRHAELLVPAIQFTCRSARVELREVS